MARSSTVVGHVGYHLSMLWNRELGLITVGRERSRERSRRDLGKGKRRAESENIL
jgi:hypothetical protein